MEKRGITLIALVITIIVLLILAGITIKLTIGDQGIIKRAQQASADYKIAEREEQLELSNFVKKLDDIKGTSEVSGTGGTKPIKEKTIVEAFEEGDIEIGDYVNYKNPILGETTVSTEETGHSKSQTYSVDSKTTWRVLGLSKNKKNLILISGSPIKRTKEDGKDTSNPYLIMGGAESYINGKDTLNKICAIYKNDLAKEVRSIEAEDILNALEVIIDKENNKILNSKGEELDINEAELESYFGAETKYNINDTNLKYAPENYMKAQYGENGIYKEKYRKLSDKKSGDELISTDYAFAVLPEIITNGTYDLIFGGTTQNENHVKSYWVATSAIGITEEDPIVGFDVGVVGGAYSGIAMFGSNRRLG